ncbi:TonB-dependent receptor [Segetibacter sp. 3557_3]|uniref:SusC/RagA family TonB-linked outer membrane protein n=1 Tax=Segetibacter sp. 3557_3 TaxID=2547429 RepID=UPI001058B9DC|nr:TonB-dependent receptor [Segetibacter sp. 3557_3]TDH27490.1 TonB-dependent receptor [Segetibacter sp. 3557_3]
MKHLLLAMCAGLLVGVPAYSTPRFIKEKSPKVYYQKPVSGRVTNDRGEPLADVTVLVTNGTASTLTRADGTFSIAVPDNATSLSFSYVGLETQEVPLNNRTTINVQLKSLGNALDEVVVIGYGTTRKINLTGSVASVKGDVLTQRPVPNVANMLEGRVAGLQVTQPSAEPGRDNANLLIRGRASFGAGSGPLVLIDGVTGNINNLSPDDVENITVLKDAASAAIYGSRSANGVILVTTKKGRRGQTTVSYRVNVGRHTPTALPKLITNSAEYMKMYNAAANRQGVAFKYPQADIDKYESGSDPAQYPNFNAIDYYFNPATVTNHNLSISGGTERSTFNVSMSYLNQDAMLAVYNFKRYNALLNYTNQVTSGINVGTTINMTYKNRQEPPFTSENLALLVYAAGPLYGPFLPDGSGRIVSRAYELEGRNRNVQEAFEMGYQNTKEYNLNAQAYIDIKLLKGLTWSSKVAINYVDEYYKMYQHPYSAYLLQDRGANNEYRAQSFGPDYLGVTDQYSKSINPTVYSVLNYDTKFGNDHNFKALVGYEQLYNRNQGLRGRRLNGVSSAITEIAGYNATGEQINATYPRLPGLPGVSEWALQSVFGRVNYDYKGKYLLEVNARYDGTSRVSPEFRWGFFPSVSAGWLVSNEDFFRDNVSAISNLKLRASYGTLGNQDIGNYSYQNVLTVSGGYPFGNAAPVSAAVLNSFKDQSLQWESTRTIDYGIDLDLRKNVFGFTFDWFRRTTSDILAAQPVPASLGLTSSTFNNGSMQSQGIELELRHQQTIGKVHYGVNAQVSTAKNKVLDIKVPGFGSSINQVGLPYGSHYLYIWDGIIQVEDTVAGSKLPKHSLNPNPKAGDLKMKDVNSDGVIDANDRVVVDGAYPNYMYSFGFNVDYKGLSLSAFFQGVQGIKNRVTGWGVDPFHQHSAPSEKWRDAWTPANRSNTLPAMYIQGYTGVSGYAASTFYLMDASYLRLKNVVLSYSLPRSLIGRIKAKELTVYLSGDNLFTITNYEGSDPERSSTTGNFAQYPQARVFNAGVNIKF